MIFMGQAQHLYFEYTSDRDSQSCNFSLMSIMIWIRVGREEGGETGLQWESPPLGLGARLRPAFSELRPS